jgi:hypothetical protein
MPFRWLFEEGQKEEACLDRLSHEDWIEFVFDHPAPKKGQDRWYSLDQADAYYYKDSPLFLSRLKRLMLEPDMLLSRYSTGQIIQGFWCFISAFELPDALEDKAVDFEARHACIAALEPLYRKLFRRQGFEKIAFMYWDPLAYSFWSGEGKPRDGDHALIQDAMLEVLQKIILLPERSCFLGALHGLGHLRHQRGHQAIHEAVARRENLRAADLEYALACIRGDMDSAPNPLNPG